MMAAFSLVFSQGQIYIALYLYLVVTMFVENLFESERLSKFMGRTTCLIFILFIGLRWETGTDWKSYIDIFYSSELSLEYVMWVYSIDTGYIIFNALISGITSNYSIFLLIDAAVAIIGVYYMIEKLTRFRNMAMLIFFSSYMITHFMGSNRRMLAIGLVCSALIFVISSPRLRERPWRWVSLFGLAATLHRTSLLFAPVVFVSRRAWSPLFVIGGLALCVVFGMSGIPYAFLEWLAGALSEYAHITFVEKLLFYTSGVENQAAADFDIMGQALLGAIKRSTTIIIFVLFMAYGRPDERSQRLYNIYVVGCGIYFLMIGAPVFQAISTYYTIVEIVLTPILFSQVPRLKIPYLFYVAAAQFLLMLNALSPYLSLYVPYRSVFSPY